MEELDTLMSLMITNAARGYYTSCPAVVLTVKQNGASMLVDVQPLVSDKDKDGTVTVHSSILNVPLQMPSSSVGGVVFPVVPGDNVLLVFSMRGIDTWKYGEGTPLPPSDSRFMDKKDCIAIPCIFPSKKAIAAPQHHSGDYALGDVIVFNSKTACEVILKQSGDIVVNSSGKVTVNCQDSEVNASNSVKYNTGQFTINSDTFQVNTGAYALSATTSATTNATMSMTGSFILNGIAMESHGHIEQGDGNRVSNPVT